MRDSNPHARRQLILSQPCLPFHQFPVNNMVGAARFERAMIVMRTLVTIAPRCAGLCIPVPPSAYKVAFRSRTYWKRGRPVSSNPEQGSGIWYGWPHPSERAWVKADRNTQGSQPVRLVSLFLVRYCGSLYVEPLTEQLVTYSVGKRRTRRLPQQLSIAVSLCVTAMFVAQLNMDSQRVGFRWLRVCLHDQQDSTLLL